MFFKGKHFRDANTKNFKEYHLSVNKQKRQERTKDLKSVVKALNLQLLCTNRLVFALLIMPYGCVSGHTSVSASNRFIAFCLSRMSAKMLYLRFLGFFGAFWFWFWFGLVWFGFFFSVLSRFVRTKFSKIL